MTKMWKYDDEAKVWRLMLVSQIQNNALRRVALLATLPLMFLWWVGGVVYATAKFAGVAALHVLLIPAFPVFQIFRSFPIELFRSFARRWNEPMEPQA